jgi:pimeloyl-ACP methyl ester carboxylesterase
MGEAGSAGRPPAPGGAADLLLAFEARGPVDAPVLVLLHGTRRTRAMWRHQLDGLSDTFRVLAVDLPGHGALADVRFRLGDATDLVSAVIDAAAGGRAIVVGQSLGGYVGMDLAARRPDQVAGLVLANATGEPRSIARRAPRTVGSYLLVAATERVRGSGAQGDDHAGDGDGAAPRATDGEHEDGPATNGWLFKGGTRALVSALREVFKPRLARYPGPTLILNGEEDDLFRHAEQAFLAAAVDGRLVVIPGSGHEVNEDQPAAFNAAVRSFAAEVHGTPAEGRATPAELRATPAETPGA